MKDLDGWTYHMTLEAVSALHVLEAVLADVQLGQPGNNKN